MARKISEAGVRRVPNSIYQQFAPCGIAPGDATRTISGSPETSGHEITAADSCDWPHPARSVIALIQTPNRSAPSGSVAYCWIGR